MGLLQRLRKSSFLIRLRHWEYWPFGIVQFPVFLYFIWLSLRARSLLFFSASNPGIPMGGMFGESKFEILQKLDRKYTARGILVRLPTTARQVVESMEIAGLSLPVIAKPDIGERGFMVEKLSSCDDVDKYIRAVKTDFIVQELVELPCEFGVFYRRYPGRDQGEVTSVVAKEMLSVKGDGKSNLRELILAKDRARLQWKTLSRLYAMRLNDVLAADETIELVSIGNHCRGTKFLNANDLIDPRLSDTFDRISKSVDGFYFGRFDLRCGDPRDLYTGDLKILELNGCGAEPAHIYDPSFKLADAIRVLLRHWCDIFDIAVENHRRGQRYLTFKEGLAYYRRFKAAVR